MKKKFERLFTFLIDVIMGFFVAITGIILYLLSLIRLFLSKLTLSGRVIFMVAAITATLILWFSPVLFFSAAGFGIIIALMGYIVNKILNNIFGG